MIAAFILGCWLLIGIAAGLVVRKLYYSPTKPELESSSKQKYCTLMLRTAKNEIDLYGTIMSGSVNNHLMNCGCITIQQISPPEPPPLKPDFDIIEPKHYGTKGLRYGLDALLTPNERRKTTLLGIRSPSNIGSGEQEELFKHAMKAMKEYRGDG